MKSKLITVLLTMSLTILFTLFCISEVRCITPKDAAKAAELVRYLNLPGPAQILVGIKCIQVIPGDLGEDAKSAGLTKEQLKTDVELKLRLAGVKVISTEERLASEDWARLYVHINSVSVNDSPNIIYNVSVKIGELFNRTRSPYRSIFGTTWTKSGLGMCSNEEFQEVARKSVKDYTDIFINDYLTANPKK